ncbi:MAG: MoaF N-terminal domain-containing protein [Pseudomonadales bacterium]|nr:MoaF N-terminal domain-containing protein [Pseudomonadales bacterium]
MKPSLMKGWYLRRILLGLLVFSTFAQGRDVKENEAYDASYLGEGLKTPPLIKLVNNTHPVTFDLIGKEYHISYDSFDKPFVAVAYFVDEQNLEWWVETDTVKTIRKAKYVVFKITPDIYFVNWVDAEAIPRDASKGVSFKDNYLVAFVMDLKNKTVTDSYMRPSEKGLQEWHLQQATASVREHKNR